ncbi:MAG: hypothetical protein HC824_12255 [Synechococcales cyanobacterium RM1_1_8]|nr:hypothetical protein [Synechococcales cyanobacterium RM1_1_8]
MASTLFSPSLGLAGLTGLMGAAIALSPTLLWPTPVAAQAAAQAPAAGPTGCRITLAQIGVYPEPNLTSDAVGILAKEVTVILGAGSGEGWARIVAPQAGWVQGQFLRGDRTTPCPPGQGSAAANLPSPTIPSPTGNRMPAPRPTPTAGGAIGENGSISRAVCAVLPEAGLIVRDQPSLEGSRVIGSIRPGNYTFQFTQRRASSPDVQGLRQWVYITAPAKGWVSTGFGAEGGNLQGEGCL